VVTIRITSLSQGRFLNGMTVLAGLVKINISSKEKNVWNVSGKKGVWITVLTVVTR